MAPSRLQHTSTVQTRWISTASTRPRTPRLPPARLPPSVAVQFQLHSLLPFFFVLSSLLFFLRPDHQHPARPSRRHHRLPARPQRAAPPQSQPSAPSSPRSPCPAAVEEEERVAAPRHVRQSRRAGRPAAPRRGPPQGARSRPGATAPHNCRPGAQGRAAAGARGGSGKWPWEHEAATGTGRPTERAAAAGAGRGRTGRPWEHATRRARRRREMAAGARERGGQLVVGARQLRPAGDDRQSARPLRRMAGRGARLRWREMTSRGCGREGRGCWLLRTWPSGEHAGRPHDGNFCR